AARMGYIPDPIARQLRTGLGGGLGFLVPDLAGPGVMAMLRGFERAAARAGLAVTVAVGGAKADGEWEGFRRLLAGQVSRAVIVGSPGMGQRSPLLREAAVRRVPLVYLNQFPAAAPQYENVGRVAADWAGAGRLAVEAVAARGHRGLGYLAGRVSGSGWAEHFQGVMATAERLGVSLVHTVFSDPESREAGQKATRELLADGTRITALVCAGDRMARGALAELKHLGRERKVAVVGCGGEEGQADEDPGLATVRIPWEDLGRRAAERLVAGGKGGEERLPVTWEEGASLFAAR
ncbi:MAG: LacI family DNA-binding transcriptional regulator, partial [Verrucomicrobiia bacterium]